MEVVKRRVVLVFGGRRAIPRSLETSQVIDYVRLASPSVSRSWTTENEFEIGTTGLKMRLRVLNDSVQERQMLSQLFFPDLQDVS